MKKVLLIGALLASSVAQQALAEGAVAVVPPPPGCPKPFQGFWFGGNVGYGIGHARHHFSESQTDAEPNGDTDVFTLSGKNNLGYRGFDGGLMVGYDYRFNCSNWVVGLGFNANWTSAKAKSEFDFTEVETTTVPGDGEPVVHVNTGEAKGHVQVRLKNSFQLYGKLGYVIREIAMPYVAFGWDNSKYKVSATGSTTFTETVGGGDPVTTTEPFDLSGGHKRVNGFMYKTGIDLLATRHFIVGLSYTGVSSQKHHGVKPQYNKFALEARIIY